MLKTKVIVALLLAIIVLAACIQAVNAGDAGPDGVPVYIGPAEKVVFNSYLPLIRDGWTVILMPPPDPFTPQ